MRKSYIVIDDMDWTLTPIYAVTVHVFMAARYAKVAVLQLL